MRCVFRQWIPVCRRTGGGFTLVEIVAALAILIGILSTAMVVMNNAVEAAIEMRSRRQAFEVARENLESLLTVSTVSDKMEYGYSEKYPEIRWELRVEPFYEPISSKMWIRAVSSAVYRDRDEQDQTVELEQWLTGLTAQQIKQILDQQEIEEKILKELYGDQDDQIQKMTGLYLKQKGLNASAYEEFLRRQRREKLDYLLEHGFDDGYRELLEAMEAEEFQFLRDQGVNFDQLDEFIGTLLANPQLVPALESGDLSEGLDELISEPESPPEASPTEPEPQTPQAEGPDCPFDCDKMDPSLKPLVCQLTGCCCN